MATPRTVARVARELLDSPDLCPRTRKLYEGILAGLVAQCGSIWIGQVTREQVETYLKSLTRLGVRTHHLHQTVIHRLFSFAIERDFSEKNPVMLINRRKPDPTKGEHRSDEAVKYLTQAQLKTLIRAASTNPRLSALLWILYESGARIAEILALKLKDVDLAERQFDVIGKGNKKRLCFYGKRAASALKGYIERDRHSPSPALFTERLTRSCQVRPLSYATAYRDLREAIDQYESLKGTRFHDLRHTFATERAQIVPLEILRALLGHEKIQTTLIYQKITSRVARESAEEALQKIAKSWSGTAA
ncbi:tyrosine-type recombinase/integrase [Nodosilinea sp. LEGE 06152]|uniref:tyrosine-type recombinase/integrase n=1 Tax=Nodosilinea sp. LEGE 06152 TaxID=2777966 RepID=UPI00187EB07E|nr:tyrosine-type recombinase/integrase [Nodosilinea sp. LEGE 06152]MBE9156010.1 tyrosine-type recombinase/integrase [Nodosilinea sp. LEGE 06152]